MYLFIVFVLYCYMHLRGVATPMISDNKPYYHLLLFIQNNIDTNFRLYLKTFFLFLFSNYYYFCRIA